jgi:N-acetylmuramoyl-L-alanine amidase
MREINKIIIHCSDSAWGDAEEIDKWHKQRGWSGIGYHYVITNGHPKPSKSYQEDLDGVVQEGRPIKTPGAHAKGHNKNSVGICLIGKYHFSGKQLYRGLLSTVELLMTAYNIPPEEVYGHTELDPGKSCPDFDVELLRELLKR